MVTNSPRIDVYSSAHFAIEIDGIAKSGADLPTLRTVEGGGAKAEMVSYQMGGNGDIWRQLGRVKYDDIKLTLGLADAMGFWTWIDDFLHGKHIRRGGSIIAADFNYKERARRHFEEAILVEVGFPKWDANDKNQANITITLAPEKVVYMPPSGGGAQITPSGMSQSRQKHITACNFRLALDSFSEEVTKRVTKVDAFAIKVKTVEHVYGGRMEAAKLPGKMEWPNLTFYLPELDAQPLRDLHNARVAGTRADQGVGQTGSLVFYNNRLEDQGEFKFKGIHIFNVSAEKGDASSEEMKLTKVECALEGLEFKLYDK